MSLYTLKNRGFQYDENQKDKMVTIYLRSMGITRILSNFNAIYRSRTILYVESRREAVLWSSY